MAGVVNCDFTGTRSASNHVRAAIPSATHLSRAKRWPAPANLGTKLSRLGPASQHYLNELSGIDTRRRRPGLAAARMATSIMAQAPGFRWLPDRYR